MPFQSRLFNGTIRQAQRWQDRIGRGWRQAKLHMRWGVEALLYPLMQIRQSLKQGLGPQRDQYLDKLDKEVLLSPIAKTRQFFQRVRRWSFRTGLAPLGRLRQRLSLQQRLIKPVQSASLTPASRITKSLVAARHPVTALVRRTAVWLRPIVAPLQKFSTQFVWRSPDQSGGVLQTSDNVLATPREANTLPKALWGWIKAAMVYFFGEDDCNQNLRGLFPFSGHMLPAPEQVPLSLPAASFSMVLLPGMEQLVPVVLRIIRRGVQAITPWMGGNRALPVDELALTHQPPAALLPLQQSTLMIEPDLPHKLRLETTDGLSWDNWRRLTALTAEPQSPLQTTLIEVQATVMGYVEHPLSILAAWLDRAVRWLEDAVLDLLQWFGRLVQQVKRHCLHVLSQTEREVR